MRIVVLIAFLAALPTALAAQGHFSTGDTAADGHHWVIQSPVINPGDVIEATLTWSTGDRLMVWGAFTCPASGVGGTAPPECYTFYGTHEATGCDGWGSTILDASPATVSFTAFTRARHEIYVRDVAATGFTSYTLDVEVNGVGRGVSLASTASTGAGWVSCDVGYEGP